MIKQFHEISFHLNLSDIDVLFNSTYTLINAYQKDELYKEDEKFQIETKEILEHLNEQHNIYKDLLAIPSKPTATTNNRVKRYSIFEFALGQDAKLEESQALITKHSNAAINKYKELSAKFEASVKNLNLSNSELAKSTNINQLEIFVDIITESIQSILTMQQRKRMSTTFVDITFLGKQMNLLKKLLRSDEEIPYEKVGEYYYSLETSIHVKGNKLMLSVQVPFVENTPRLLYKIHELPSYYNSTLLITDVKWKYLAVGETDVVKMMNFDDCLTVNTPNMFLCNSQSPIMNLNDSSDCLINAFVKHEIDFTTCQTSAADFSQLVFIKLSNGKYFYFSPQANTTLNSTCNGTSEMQNIETQTGILWIEQGCKVFTDRYELRSTRSIKHDETKIDLHIGYVEGELREIFDNLTLKYYKEAIIFDEIQKMREDLKKPEPIIFGQNSVNTSSMDEIMVIFACAMIIVFIFILIRNYLMKQSADPKSYINKKREDIIVKIAEKDLDKPSTSKV